MSDPTARLRELAANAAREHHEQATRYVHKGADHQGHVSPFRTCLHPDCMLVREADATPTPRCLEAITTLDAITALLNGYEVSDFMLSMPIVRQVADLVGQDALRALPTTPAGAPPQEKL